MNSTLVVVRPFGAHAKGSVITDAASIAQILAGEQARCVVRVPAPISAAPTSKGA